MHIIRSATRGTLTLTLALALIVLGGAMTVLVLWLSGAFDSETVSASTSSSLVTPADTCDNANRAAGNCGGVVTAEQDGQSGYFRSLGDHGIQVVFASWRDSLLQYGNLACVLLDSGNSAVDAATDLPDMLSPDSQLLPVTNREAALIVGAAGSHLCPDHAQEIAAAYGGSF